MKLFIFDFDLTITSLHTYALLSEAIQDEKNRLGVSSLEKNAEAQWERVKHIPPISSAAEWKTLFENIINAGDRIAIASYNSYGKDIIPRYLKEVLQLPDTLISTIPIQSWLPEIYLTDIDTEKNTHIQHLLADFLPEKPEVILIDDDSSILSEARKVGYHTILATPDGQHINLAASALTKPSNEDNPYAPKLFLLKDFSASDPMTHLSNSIIVTTDYKFYTIDMKGLTTSYDADPALVKKFLATMNISESDLSQVTSPHNITSKMTPETNKAYYQIIFPAPKNMTEQPAEEKPEYLIPSDHGDSTLMLIVRFGEKTIFEEKIHSDTSFRNLLIKLEGDMKIGPNTRNRSSFFIGSHDINKPSNLDKSILKITEEEHIANTGNITIDIKRR